MTTAGISDRRPVRRVALASLVAALALVALKLATALATGSLAMLSETAHSGLDAMVTALTLYAVAVAARPPDADHPYGHGKAENVAAMAEAVALLLLAATLGREAVVRLIDPGSPIKTAWYAFVVMAASMALDAFRYRVLAATGRKYHSPALMADAVNFKADLLTSAAVLLGLGAVKLGYTPAAAIGGLAVALSVAAPARPAPPPAPSSAGGASAPPAASRRPTWWWGSRAPFRSSAPIPSPKRSRMRSAPSSRGPTSSSTSSRLRMSRSSPSRSCPWQRGTSPCTRSTTFSWPAVPTVSTSPCMPSSRGR